MKVEGLLEKRIELPCDLAVGGKGGFRTITLRESSGEDQEFCSEASIRDVPARSLGHAIARCIVDVKGCKELPTYDDINKLPAIVVDKIGLELRKLSKGDKVKVRASCPHSDTNRMTGKENPCGAPIEVEESINTFVELANQARVIPEIYTLRTPFIIKESGEEDKEITKEYTKALVSPMTNEARISAFSQTDMFRKGAVDSFVIEACVISIANKDNPEDKIVLHPGDAKKLSAYDRSNILEIAGDVETINSSKDIPCYKCGKTIRIVFPVFDFLY